MQADKDIFMKDMTWQEIKDRLKETDIVLVPAGQTEQHGPHLPIEADNFICTGIAQRAAQATFNTAKPVVAPTITFGYSDIPYFRDYPGTFTLQPETLISVYYDVAMSLVRMGFKKVIFVNGHDPNPPYQEEAMRRLTKETGAFFAMCNFFSLPSAEVQKILAEAGQGRTWGHACLIETSVSEVFGAQVRENLLQAHIPGSYPKELEEYMMLRPAGISIPSFEYKKTAEGHWGTPGPESPGTMGDPRGHSKEIGERVIKATIDPIVKLINDIQHMQVDLNPAFAKNEETRG